MLCCMNLWAQQGKIMGQITDKGEAVPFVNISLKNTKKGTSSNEDGHYEFENINPGRYIVAHHPRSVIGTIRPALHFLQMKCFLWISH